LAELVFIEEVHLDFLVPRGLPDAAARAVRRALGAAAFRAALLRGARELVRRHPALRPVRLRLSR
jgi:hypothetical protein